jgi:hypothetical protein
VSNGSITPTADRFSTNYNALQIGLERRFKNGFQLQSNYAWAHLIVTEAAQCRACTERANTGLGKNQRFTTSASYELPFMKTSTGLVRAVAAGWQLNGVLITHTGSWLTVSNQSTRTGFVSTSLTGGGGGIADRPDIVRNPNNGLKTVQHWFDTGAFVGQTLGTYGDAGGGVVQGPGLTTVDFALAKSFRVREGMAFKVRLETFNSLNHPNLGSPNVSLGSALFGQVTSALDPRTFQVAARLTF